MEATSFASQFNLRSPAVKRLMKEAAELKDSTEDYYAQPLENNLFEWHFTVRGPPDSDFEDGIYHGRIILPTEYPMKPPSIILLTPTGRFEVNKKICLSISGHHPESWQPSWSIRTALLAIIGFMPTESLGAIGGLDYTSSERQELATKSHSWLCQACGPIKNLLKEREEGSNNDKDSQEAQELAKQIRFEELIAPPKNQKYDVGSSSSQSNVNTSNDIRRRKVGLVQTGHSSRDTSMFASNANSNSESSSVQSRTRSSTYLILLLTLAIAFLLFRRVFLSG